jgi:hypothetical protein
VRSLFFATLILSAGCAGVDLRYAPVEPGYPLAAERVSPIASIEFKDLAGGLQQDGTNLVLKRPFIDAVRDAALARLAAWKVPVGTAGGAALRVEVKESSVKRGRGFNADITAAVKYTVRVSRDGKEVCSTDASGWAVVHEKIGSASAVDAVDGALAKAVDNLGPALASSCLYASGDAAAVVTPAAPVARDAGVVALVMGVERRRNGAPADGAAADAKAFAAELKTRLGAGDDRSLLLLDDAVSLADMNKTLDHWLPYHVAPGDRVVVYFAGHGARDGKGTAYLVPYDGDAAYLDSTAFPLPRLFAGLGRLPATVTVVLDASFSGSGGRTLTAPAEKLEMDATPPANVTVLRAASQGLPASAVDGRGRFTAALVRAMDERGGDLGTAFDAVAATLAGQKPARVVGR